MKKLHYSKAHRLDQLTDELFKANPGWITTDAEGRRFTSVAVEDSGDDIWATVPDATPDTAVAAVVAAHKPDPMYGRDLEYEDAVAAFRDLWDQKLAVPTPGLALNPVETARFQRAVAVLLRKHYPDLRG